MRKLICTLAVVAGISPLLSFAQHGIIKNVAGGGYVNGYSGDGWPATDPVVGFGSAAGIAVDSSGNLYIADWGTPRIRKVDAVTNIINTIAGNGISGYSGNWGPALSAEIDGVNVGLCVDDTGNVYFVEYSNASIRKVNVQTGVISPVAGAPNNVGGNGGPAVDASLGTLCDVYVDHSGNIYLNDAIYTGSLIKKIDALTGIIDVFAGNGINGYSGDGGPATAAQIDIATLQSGLTGDLLGNIYMVDNNNYRIRKIDANGIITTVAGNGIKGYTGDGGMATNAEVDSLYDIATDAQGNIYFTDCGGAVIRKIDGLTGIITTVAGKVTNNTGGDYLAGVPADSVRLDADCIFVDRKGNILYSHHNTVRKITFTPTASSDSFAVYVIPSCSGPAISVNTHTFNANMHVKTYFGDSQVPLDTGLINVYNTGEVTFNHLYAATGTYTIKQILYDGMTKIDSLSFTYENKFCNSFSVFLYKDMNGNCQKDPTELGSPLPALIEVDSNNVAVDMLSVTSGFYYTAFGNPGDVYSFKLVSAPAGLQVSCPITGVITQTLQVTDIIPAQYLGFNCIPGNNFDLSADAIIPVTGRYDQWGNIYVRNNYCAPSNATVTLNFSPKYVFNAAQPAPSSTTATSITWNLASLSSNDLDPAYLHYSIWNNPAIGILTVNDTVQTHISVTPSAGDMDVSNNVFIHGDTVKGSCDPNLIEVTPKGNIPAGTQLKYRIEFENVGNDTAFNIYVLDTLPNELDASSLRLVSSTHTMYVSKLEDGAHTIMKFDFPGINLLDSSHHDACTGTFTYTINTRTGLPFGTHIDHAAGIYFDANGVVETNTVENIIGWPAGVANVSNNKVQVYPNPANNELNIKQTGTDYTSFTISNSIGQAVTEQQLDKEVKVNIKMLPAGVYYVTLKGVKGNEVKKFVKM